MSDLISVLCSYCVLHIITVELPHVGGAVFHVFFKI